MRIPQDSTLAAGSSVNFKVITLLDDFEAEYLSQTTSGLTIDDGGLYPLTFCPLEDLVWIKFGVAPNYNTYTNNSNIQVTNITTFNVSIYIPAFTNHLLQVVISSLNYASMRPFADIRSARIVSMGRNVDGLFNDYSLYGKHQPEFVSSVDEYYADHVVFDLGIITNTGTFASPFAL